jgi:RNA polymerase sigma-70 factor (ECF subfamily)
MNERPKDGRATGQEARRLLAGHEGLVEWLCAQAAISNWGLARGCFAEAMERSAAKHFAGETASAGDLEGYLRGLHLQDLALACACAAGHAAAWEHFVAEYRAGLRAAAAAIFGKRGSSAEARELADSLFAELYGVDRRAGSRESLLRYYHGRSKLSTWLRSVLAQRHVDYIREHRRFEPLADGEDGGGTPREMGSSRPQFFDPDRARYLVLLRRAFDAALGRLQPLDHRRLWLYYVESRTLADIGRSLGEHESSVSRNLERIRKELRRAVEEFLRCDEGPVDGQAARRGLSEAQITLCFEYALEDAPLDLGKALGVQPLRPAERPKP